MRPVGTASSTAEVADSDASPTVTYGAVSTLTTLRPDAADTATRVAKFRPSMVIGWTTYWDRPTTVIS